MHSLSISSLSRLLIISVLSLFLAACFGNGDGSSSGGPGSIPGKLVFSELGGVTFKTATREGLTSPRGDFTCLPGETIRFAVGDIDGGFVIGSAPCARIITAVELTGSSNPNDPRVANLLSFIYSLDSDQNHLNGVVISQAVHDLINTYTGISLDLSRPNFQNDLDVLIAFLNAGAGISLAVVNAAAALDAFCFDTYLPGGGSGVFGFTFDGCDDTQTNTDPEELLQNGDFEGAFTFIDDPEGAGQGFLPQGWDTVLNFALDCIGNVCAGGSQTIDGYSPHAGANSMRLFGPNYFIKFYPEPEVTGAYQDIDVVGGETYTASIMAQNFEGSLFARNFLLLSLIFSTDGDFTDGVGEYAVELEASGEDDPESGRLYLPPGEWTKMAVTTTTTPDTVKARFQILHLQFPDEPEHSLPPFPIPGELISSVFIDDASVIGPKLEFPPDEYIERWRDDFDGTYDWRENAINGNPLNWQPEFAYQEPGTPPELIGWGNNEWQYYSDDADVLRVEDGILKITALCGVLDGDEVIPESPGGSAAFVNPGFEVGAVNGALLGNGWITEGTGTNTLNETGVGFVPFAQEGSFMLRQVGPVGALQSIDVVPDEEVQASAYALNWQFNQFSDTAELAVKFYKSNGDFIEQDVTTITPPGGGGDVILTVGNGDANSYIQITTPVLIAPAEAATAEIQLTNSGPSSIYWDNVIFGAPPVLCNPTNRGGNNNPADATIFSARLNTADSLSDIKYGKIEARIKVPGDKGAWPAFWMLGSSSFDGLRWPRVGEIDIMEIWTQPSAAPGNEFQTHATLHWCDESDPEYDPNLETCYTGFTQGGHASEGGSASVPGPGGSSLALDDDFYIYSVEWNSRRFLFKIRTDGGTEVVVFERDIDETMEEFNKPFYMILNLAMGGTLGSNGQNPVPANSAFPQTMEVDWVSVSEIAPKF